MIFLLIYTVQYIYKIEQKNMSNFHQLKNMWENKGGVQTNAPPPMKPLSQKFKSTTTNQKRQSNPITPTNPQSISAVQTKPNNEQIVETEMPRRSVAQLKNNLQGKIKLGPSSNNNPYASIYQPNNNLLKPSQPQFLPNMTKLSSDDQNPIKSQQIKPNFKQSKAMLEKLYQRKSGESNKSQKIEPNPNQPNQLKQGYYTGPPQSNQVYIDLKKQQQSYQKLTPQERTQQIIQRIFPQASLSAKFSQHVEINNTNSLLSKQEEVVSLSVRAKKEKKNLGDFDDA